MVTMAPYRMPLAGMKYRVGAAATSGNLEPSGTQPMAERWRQHAVRILLVYAHPVEQSYAAALRDAVLAALAEGGHQVDFCDLYAEGFQAALTREERLAYHTVPAMPMQLRVMSNGSGGRKASSSSFRPGGTACRRSSKAGSTASGCRA